MRAHLAASVIACALLASACSVSTPRHESATPLRAGNPTVTQARSVADEAAAVAGDQTLADGSTSALPRTAETGDTRPMAANVKNAVAPVAGGDSTGVTKDTISLSVLAGFSGPLAPITNKAWEAMLTWQEDVNAAGGINGRKVVMHKVDHKETAAGGVAACKEVQSNKSFIAAVPEGVEANVTAVDCLDAAGIPSVYFAAQNNPKWKRAFSDLVSSAEAGTVMASFIRNHLGFGTKNLGVMYVNQAAYSDVVGTLQAEGRTLGLKVISTEAVEPNQASFTSQLLKMREAGVQVLVVSATTEAIGIVRDARNMGWDVPITGWGYVFDFVTAAAHDLFKGITGLRAYATVDAPAYETYRKHMNARGRNRDDRTADLEGFVTYGRALLYGELLRLAGPNPTRESFLAGAETMRGYDNGIVPPITYGPGDHLGASAAFPVACCNSDYTWKSTGPAKARF